MADTLYIVCNVAVLPGWILLIAAPRWKWTTSLITTVLLPFCLGLVYIALIAANAAEVSGGFASLADVGRLFENPFVLLAGWVHYLAFDLFVGSWQVRDAGRVGLSRWLVIPCLLATFLFGPAGLVLYYALRWSLKRRFLTVADAASV